MLRIETLINTFGSLADDRYHLEINKKTEPFLALPLRTDFDYFSSLQIEYPLGLDIGKSSWIRLIAKARMLNFY